MVLKKVRIESDVLQVCTMHALTTEKEAVMGWLLGEVCEDVAHVNSLLVLRHADKGKDRVEISAEQLFSSAAEPVRRLTHVRRDPRVLGWYCSHPQRSVWPSYVDLKAQASYQLVDSDFVGLILSCFNHDAATVCAEVQVTCFQSACRSRDGDFERVEIAHEIVPCTMMSVACLDQLMNIPKILLDEEMDAYRCSLGFHDQDLITALQNATVFSQAVTKILEVVCSPILLCLESQLRANELTIEQLSKTNKTNQID